MDSIKVHPTDICYLLYFRKLLWAYAWYRKDKSDQWYGILFFVC